jgi:hypothetical protein
LRHLLNMVMYPPLSTVAACLASRASVSISRPTYAASPIFNYPYCAFLRLLATLHTRLALGNPIVEPWLVADPAFASEDATPSLRALTTTAIRSQLFHVKHRSHACL